MESDTDSTAIGYPARQTKITHFLSRSSTGSGSNENVMEAPGPARKKSKQDLIRLGLKNIRGSMLMKLLNLVWTLVCFVVYVESITCLARK